MNLKKASLLLIIGALYTVFYKAIFVLFPFIVKNSLANSIFSALWILSTLSLILFVYYFLKEITKLNSQIKISLCSIILFTSLIILFKLPYFQTVVYGIQKILIFKVIRLLNSIVILFFCFSFYKIISDKYSLNQSLNLVIWAVSISLLLELISFGYYMNFILTGNESIPFPPLQILAVIVFLFTYYAVINFLIKFRKVEDYTKLVVK
jgi:hypothetical protein